MLDRKRPNLGVMPSGSGGEEPVGLLDLDRVLRRQREGEIAVDLVVDVRGQRQLGLRDAEAALRRRDVAARREAGDRVAGSGPATGSRRRPCSTAEIAGLKALDAGGWRGRWRRRDGLRGRGRRRRDRVARRRALPGRLASASFSRCSSAWMLASYDSLAADLISARISARSASVAAWAGNAVHSASANAPGTRTCSGHDSILQSLPMKAGAGSSAGKATLEERRRGAALVR